MNKKIFILTILSIVVFWAGEAHAFIALPFFDITINEHITGGDTTFNFDVEGGTPENFFSDQLSMQTVNGTGSAFTSSISPSGASFFITQSVVLGWQKPIVTCTSTNPAVTSVPTDDGDGVVIKSAPFSSVVCDFTNNPESVGASSVLFIPGFEASRLYKEGGLLNDEDQLWEPNSNFDVKNLFMDIAGISKNQSIYTRDIIGRTNLIAKNIDIYRTFQNSLDQMVSDGLFSSWESVAYDWRYDPAYIVEHGMIDPFGHLSYTTTLPENQKPYIIAQVEALARSSKNGKVTIVTHSNGGLIMKALIKKMQEMHDLDGNDDIEKIDKVIMIGAPQFGTPVSIAKMLHGYNTKLGGGLILSESTARDFGKNLPGAYTLLPSEVYFENINTPVVRFDESLDVVSNLRKKYGDSIATYSKMSDFLLGVVDNRKEPDSKDLLRPSLLNGSLLTASKLTHEELDNYKIPSDIKLYTVAGWGQLTPVGVEYLAKNECFVEGCVNILDEKIIPTFDGDKTVVTPSATLGEGTHYYLNLQDYNFFNKKNYEHLDILEVPNLQTLVKNIIIGNSEIPQYVSTTKPIDTDNLVLSIHSPVSIHVYDQNGKHTGLARTQNSSDFLDVDEEIPNSSFLSFGEGDYVSVPMGLPYTVALTGTDFGTFSFQKEHYRNDLVQTRDGSSFVDIPVTPMTVATLTIDSNGTPTQMQIDIDGDGLTDESLTSNSDFDPKLYLQMMRKTIISMHLAQGTENALIKKISKLESLIQLGKLKNAKNKIKGLLKIIKLHRGHKNQLDAAEKQTLVGMFNIFLDNIN